MHRSPVAPQLGRLLRGREGMLYFVFNREVIAVVVAHNIDAGEFVAQVGPGMRQQGMPAAAACGGPLDRLNVEDPATQAHTGIW